MRTDDDDLEPQRPFGVDDVGERLGGVGNHRKLARRCTSARSFNSYSSSSRGIDPFQVGPLPQHVRLLGVATRVRRPQCMARRPETTLLHQQRIADVLEDRAAAAGADAPEVFRQFARQAVARWSQAKTASTFRSSFARITLVASASAINSACPLVRALQHDGAARQDLFVLVGRDLDSRAATPPSRRWRRGRVIRPASWRITSSSSSADMPIRTATP